jgi:hypothetical protein
MMHFTTDDLTTDEFNTTKKTSVRGKESGERP